MSFKTREKVIEEQKRAALRENVGMQPGESVEAWIRRSKNESYLNPVKKVEAPQPTKAEIIAGGAAQQARLDAIAAKEDEQRAADRQSRDENPFWELAENENATPRERKRWKTLAKQRDTENAAKRQEAERVAKLQARPEYQAAIAREEKTVSGFPDEYRERVIVLHARLKGDYDVDAFNRDYRSLLDEAKAATDAKLKAALAETSQSASQVVELQIEGAKLNEAEGAEE